MIERIFDFLWPRSCAVCSRPVDRPGRYLCTDCLNRLPMLPSTGLCRCCGIDAPGLDDEFLCDVCAARATRPAFDRVASAMYFLDEARALMNAFKFRSAFYLRNDFVDLLEGTVRSRFRIDTIECVLAMPSTRVHRILRGYNQCDYLAAPLARRLGIVYAKGAMRRIGNPQRQSSLGGEDRQTNVIGTFELTRRGRSLLAGMGTVLVIDDIMTTGSTLSECARMLKESGVKKVFAATVCRALRC